MSTSSRPPLAASPIARIGSCAACLGRARLDDGFCRDCLDSPVRGRRWAETARRIREDPRFALLVYSRIPTDTMRALFIQLFGLPPGAPAPGAAARPRLLLVTTAIACLMVLAGCHGDPVPTPAATRATSAVADLAARAPAPPSRIEATTRASVIVAPPTSSATLGATPAAPAARPCPAAPRISAEDLATGWPTRIGQRVRLTARVEIAIDAIHVVVRAGTRRFAVMLSPGGAWPGDREQTFAVLGSTTVLVRGGPQTLPELLLADPGDCEQP